MFLTGSMGKVPLFFLSGMEKHMVNVIILTTAMKRIFLAFNSEFLDTKYP